MPKTLQALWQLAAAELMVANKPTAKLDARLLLAFALSQLSGQEWSSERLLSHMTDPAPAQLEPALQKLIARRVAHEPVAMIVGYKEFYGHRYVITPDVLQPRPESEALIEQALSHITASPAPKRWQILDIGTGSGCLAISLANELERRRISYQIIATEISRAALKIARQNAQAHETKNVTFIESDLLRGVPVQKFDIVLGNLPYIPDGIMPALEPEVLLEPAVALLGGADGLELYRQLRQQINPYLAKDSLLLFECAANQKADLQHIFSDLQVSIVT